MPLNAREASLPPLTSCAASVVVTDAELRILHAEGEAFAVHGVQADQLRGCSLQDFLPSAALAQLEPRYRAALEGIPQSFDYWAQDGTHAYWVQISPVPKADEEIGSVVAVIQDITERMRTTMELARSEARLRETERMIGVGSWELVLEGGELTYSDGFARALELDPGERLNLATLMARVHPDDRVDLTEAVARCAREGTAHGEYRVAQRDGSTRTFAVRGEAVRGADGQPRYLRGAVLDITDQRIAERDRLEAMSLFQQGFDAAPIGMVLTDPQTGRYLRVNDSACQFLGRSREELMTLTIYDVTYPEDVSESDAARQSLRDGTMAGYQGEKRYVRPDGTAVWATVHVAPVRNADGSVRALFAQQVDITERKQREARLENDIQDALWLGRIRDALDNDRMVIYFQPIVDLRTGETVQRELLLRMRGEDGSVILPGEFLPVAERYGLISEIDRWVIRQAAQLAATGTPTEFNLSGASIADPAVIRELASAIKEHEVDPSLLVVEVTETAMMDQIETGRLFAERVIGLGCGLALDDFGTGFASLTYLKHLPAGTLKIDMEFVRELTRSDTDERLVRGIIGFAREFGQTTIAEGIEDEATLHRLRELGVHLGQGYLFGRPRPLHEDQITEAPETKVAVTGSPNSLAVVRAAFEAFAKRDVEAMQAVCAPDVVVRPFATMRLAGRETAYPGHDGVRRYFDDVGAVWDELELTPTMFWETDAATIAFGHAAGRHDGLLHASDVLWVCRHRDGLITSIDVFRSAAGAGDGPLLAPRSAAQDTVMPNLG
jgi:PAS domain S-box-containing protein